MDWHINGLIKSVETNHQCLITGFYDHSEVGKRNRSWSLLKQLKPNPNEACFCFGDFNDITCQHEKFGRNLIPQW